MFFSQSLVPSRSNTASSPELKKNTTRVPSVAAEGAAKLLRESLAMRGAICTCQSVSPVRRSRHMARRTLRASSVELRKTRVPEMTGVEPAEPGMGLTHWTRLVRENFPGTPVSGLEPSKFGPRHCGQSAAEQSKQLRLKNDSTGAREGLRRGRDPGIDGRFFVMGRSMCFRAGRRLAGR